MVNSANTVESLVDPLRKMSIRRFSRKSLLMSDGSSRQMSMKAPQHRVSFAFTNSISSKVADADIEKKEVILNTKENDFQSGGVSKAQKSLQQSKNISTILALATSIPLPPSPVEDNEKEKQITKESKESSNNNNSNNNFSSEVEKARLYEELEELEKQLEQEISEDMTEIS